MKKCTLLFLFFSLAVSAQESFPYKKPSLILNKTVTVIRIPASEQFGYHNFFETLKPQKGYKLEKASTPEKELLGRSFTVTAIDSFKLGGKYAYNLTLTSDTETIYYRYNPTTVGDLYPLEVKGGLDVPEGFYCDFVEKDKYEYSARVPEISLSQSYDFRTTKNRTSAIFTFFDKFEEDGVKSVTLLLENNKTIEDITNEIIAMPQSNEFRYNFAITLDDKAIELLKANKLIAVKLKDSVHTFHPGSGVTLSGILKCMGSLPLFQKP
jgi:hypothetical protein